MPDPGPVAARGSRAPGQGGRPPLPLPLRNRALPVHQHRGPGRQRRPHGAGGGVRGCRYISATGRCRLPQHWHLASGSAPPRAKPVPVSTASRPGMSCSKRSVLKELQLLDMNVCRKSTMTNADQIISVLRQLSDLDDDEIAKQIGIRRQTVNQECRLLAAKGILTRVIGGPRNKILNRLAGADARPTLGGRSYNRSPSTPSDQLNQVRSTLTCDARKIRLDSYEFLEVCIIGPRRFADGTVQDFTPQSRYHNLKSLRLNKYGRGAFCKFPHSGYT